MKLSELEIRYNLNHTLIRENGELVATFSPNVSTDEGFKIAEALQPSEFENLYYIEKDNAEYLQETIKELEEEIRLLKRQIEE
jgi:hypothetical protein